MTFLVFFPHNYPIGMAVMFHDVRRVLGARKPVSIRAKSALHREDRADEDAIDERSSNVQVGLADIGGQSSKMDAKIPRGEQMSNRNSLSMLISSILMFRLDSSLVYPTNVTRK